MEPVALYEVALLFGTLVAETILASVHVRAHRQAGHMDASDLIKALQTPCEEGVVHIWIIAVRPSRRPLRGLLRMRNFLTAIKERPHAEEHPKGASRSTHRGDALQHSVCPNSRQAPKSRSHGVREKKARPKEAGAGRSRHHRPRTCRTP